MTDAGGFYSIDRIRAGNFAVQLRSPQSVFPLINEWYDDQIDFATADPVGVEAGYTTAEVDGRLEAGNWGVVEGYVFDALGNPVANMTVGLIDPTAGFGPWAAPTDASGHYLHSNVPAGSWKVFFNAGSTSGVNLVPQYHPGTRFLNEAETVEVRGGETTNVPNAYLPLAGSISGQILNNIGSVSVIAFDTATDLTRSVSPGIPLTGNPTYTIRNLQPGTYKVLARPNQQGDRISHWYPDASSYAAAGTVTVTAGVTTSGIDITLATGGGSVSGRVLDEGGTPIAGVPVFVQDASKQYTYVSWPSNEDGEFTVRQVPPGAVKVLFNTGGNWLGFEPEYYNNKADFATANTVVVTEGSTTTLDDAVLAYRAPVAPTTTTLPNGEVAVAYSQQLSASGGRPFYRWELIGGTLPDGLTMGSSGLIEGVPTSTGTWPFTVEVTDSTLPPTSEIAFLSITIGAYTGEGYTISGTVTEVRLAARRRRPRGASRRSGDFGDRHLYRRRRTRLLEHRDAGPSRDTRSILRSGPTPS